MRRLNCEREDNNKAKGHEEGNQDITRMISGIYTRYDMMIRERKLPGKEKHAYGMRKETIKNCKDRDLKWMM